MTDILQEQAAEVNTINEESLVKSLQDDIQKQKAEIQRLKEQLSNSKETIAELEESKEETEEELKDLKAKNQRQRALIDEVQRIQSESTKRAEEKEHELILVNKQVAEMRTRVTNLESALSSEQTAHSNATNLIKQLQDKVLEQSLLTYDVARIIDEKWLSQAKEIRIIYRCAIPTTINPLTPSPENQPTDHTMWAFVETVHKSSLLPPSQRQSLGKYFISHCPYIVHSIAPSWPKALGGCRVLLCDHGQGR